MADHQLPEALRHLAVPIASLHPYPNNPRQGDIGAISQSLSAHNQYRPVVVRRADNTVLAGNHTLAAAKALGWHEIAATFVDVDDDEAARIVVVDNRTSDLATNDPEKLAALLQELAATPAGLDGSGYDGDALDELLADLGQMQPELRGDPDAVPEVPAEPVSRLGDLWLLGEHRILCGDSARAEDLDALMDGHVAQMVLADPPYNVGYTGGSSNEQEREDSYPDSRPDASYTDWLQRILGQAFAASDEQAALHLWFGSSKLRCIMDALEGAGWQSRSLIVWNKLSAHYGALGAQYKHRYEPLFYCYKRGAVPRWFGPTNEATVWDHEQPQVNDLHPTMKPVALYERSLSNHTARGAIVLECFAGSGTTLVAAERLGRRAYLMEIEPRYCDVIVQRWQDLTGKQAVRQTAAAPAEASDHARVLSRP